MIEPVCDRCGTTLQTFGGLLFGVPDKQSRAKKFHLCTQCTNDLEKEIARHPKVGEHYHDDEDNAGC